MRPRLADSRRAAEGSRQLAPCTCARPPASATPRLRRRPRAPGCRPRRDTRGWRLAAALGPATLVCELDQRRERDGLADHAHALRHGPAVRVEEEPGAARLADVGAEVHALPRARLGCEHRVEPLALGGEGRSGPGRAREILARDPPCELRARTALHCVVATVSARTLFAPLGPTYDRYSALLSFGQDPRWRRFLVSRLDVGRGRHACSTSRRAPGSSRASCVRRFGCRSSALDQSPEMLAVAAARTRGCRCAGRGAGRELPFADDEFDALTFTYLLRYVDDPAATCASWRASSAREGRSRCSSSPCRAASGGRWERRYARRSPRPGG